MRVGFWTWVKDWVSMADLLAVQKLTLAASLVSRWKRLLYVWQIVKILTRHRTPFSVFLYPQIVAAFNFKPDVNATQRTSEEIEKQILKLCAELGSRCNKLPREILTGMSFGEVDAYYRQLIMRNLEGCLNALSAHHSPVEFGKHVTEKMRKMTHEVTMEKVESDGGKFEPVSIRGMFQRA